MYAKTRELARIFLHRVEFFFIFSKLCTNKVIRKYLLAPGLCEEAGGLGLGNSENDETYEIYEFFS